MHVPQDQQEDPEAPQLAPLETGASVDAPLLHYLRSQITDADFSSEVDHAAVARVRAAGRTQLFLACRTQLFLACRFPPCLLLCRQARGPGMLFLTAPVSVVRCRHAKNSLRSSVYRSSSLSLIRRLLPRKRARLRRQHSWLVRSIHPKTRQ